MLDILWLAGDVWLQTWVIRWLTYLVLGVMLFLWALRWWVSHKEFSLIHTRLTNNLTSVTEHQDVPKSYFNNRKHYFSRLYQAYQLSQIQLSWRRFWAYTAIVSAVSALLVFAQTKSGIFTISVPVFVFGLASLFLYLKSLDQRQKLVEQIPLFLQALSNSLQAGYTLPMALEFIADEIEAPLQREVKAINQKLNLQIPLSEALETFAKKIKNAEVDFFVESTLIQIKTGGNLIELFNKISYLIEEKLKLKRDVKSFTSQGKMSGILIAALWPISVLAFSWLSPTHTEVLFNTSGGQVMLFLSLILELLGFFFIWKIISVKL